MGALGAKRRCGVLGLEIFGVGDTLLAYEHLETIGKCFFLCFNDAKDFLVFFQCFILRYKILFMLLIVGGTLAFVFW